MITLLPVPETYSQAKVSVKLPTINWLYRKVAKLNITLTEGFSSNTFEASGLQKYQLVQPPRSQNKWYDLPSLQNSAVPKVELQNRQV